MTDQEIAQNKAEQKQQLEKLRKEIQTMEDNVLSHPEALQHLIKLLNFRFALGYSSGPGTKPELLVFQDGMRHVVTYLKTLVDKKINKTPRIHIPTISH